MNAPLFHFRARVISGAGRGKTLGIPTLNLDLRDVPEHLDDGVFACRAVVNNQTFSATMHHGPRPTFGDTRSCEVHLIDETLLFPPNAVEVEVIAYLRGISTFPSAAALSNQMKKDIRQARKILKEPKESR